MTSQRRSLVAAVAALLSLPGVAFTQSARHYRLGILSIDDNPRDSIWLAFLTELARLGYVEGQNVTMVPSFVDPGRHTFESAATELVNSKVDLIYVVAGTAGVRAAMKATATTPIVMLTSSDPVRDGLVASLRRPGGNVTDNAIFGPELLAKRLQIIVELTGKPRQVALLTTTDASRSRNPEAFQKSLAAAAQAVGTEAKVFQLNTMDELEPVLADIANQRLALVVDTTSLFYVHVRRLGALVTQYRLPAVGDGRRYAEAGFLVAYGLDYHDLARKSARCIARIFDGANAGDLPVELANKFEMIVNLKAAAALGLTVPRGMLAGATEIIR
jgi:putative ABC transport system substrate-binding protein